MNKLYIGIDVQVRRPCAFAALDESGTLMQSGWFPTAREGRRSLEPLAKGHRLHIGIDESRVPLAKPREWYWNGSKQEWRTRKASEKGLGRHCEVAIKAHNLANPQWTPMKKDAPGWMQLGFGLFKELDPLGTTYEAFPSASYKMLESDPSLQLTINFSNMRLGKTDMLDAWMAAATVREYVEGRGMEVGGGDGLGTIILPRKLKKPIPNVLHWPSLG
ncbi:hypothetical protein PDESU_05941 [Pontiella desulfatans]|uniref:DUF429 domain-containing protein n=1 Tax=Pontiella desulfatans TaxID=2750659 RepID=A0A6C2UBC8_PONDE|nr:hypothetical protein [Pontiella desulfatans]VGO17345.1 hypothetical protein PDESU_05941 [Pontiella desulfatans]